MRRLGRRECVTTGIESDRVELTVRGSTEVTAGKDLCIIKRDRFYRQGGMLMQAKGVGLTMLGAVFCAQVFVAVDRHSHSVSDTLYGIFPYFVPCLVLLHWVASKTSGTIE
jgi:hypothetical protein